MRASGASIVDSMLVESNLTVTEIPPGAGCPTDWVMYIRVVKCCSPSPCIAPPSSFMVLCCSRA